MARRRKRKVTSKRRRRRASPFKLFGNSPSPRRRVRKRRARRNPHYRYRRNQPRIQNLTNDVMLAGLGFMGTKIVGNMATPMLAGFGAGNDLVRLGIKAGLAYFTAWGITNFGLATRASFTPIFLGGMTEVIQDTVKTFISPMFPALAAYEDTMGAYYLPAPQLGQYGLYEEEQQTAL